MAKRSLSNIQGNSQVFYEVIASSIDQNYIEVIPNSNQVCVKFLDSNSDSSLHRNECSFLLQY